MFGKFLYWVKGKIRLSIKRKSKIWNVIYFIYKYIFRKILQFFLFAEMFLFNFKKSIKFMKNNPGWTFLGLRLHLYGEKIAHEIFPILNKLNVRAFLYGGTLLGYVREKGFIKHDDDFDLGIFEKDIPKMKLLKKELLRINWKLKNETSEIIVFEKPEFYYLNVDIYYFFDKGNYFFVPPYCQRKKENLKDLIKQKYFNESIYIPKKYLDHLKECFGKNWKVPKFVSQNERERGDKLRELKYKQSQKVK